MSIFKTIPEKLSAPFKNLQDRFKKSFDFLQNITFQRWAIAIFLCAGLTFIIAPRVYNPAPEYRHGMIATENIKAERDFLVEDANSTQQKRTEATAEVRYVYDFDAEISITISTKLNEDFDDFTDCCTTDV